jgi:hypothetical protein
VTGEAAVSGYRPMERDTMARDTATNTTASDTSSTEMAGASDTTAGNLNADTTTTETVTADTTTAGYSEMARDTSSAAGQGDTAAVAMADVADTANIQVQVDTTTAQVQADTSASVQTDTLSVATADTTNMADTTNVSPDVAAVRAEGDTLQQNAGRVRPPEDSTEILGNVTTDTATVASNDTSESDRIRPPEDSTETHANAASADVSVDAAGAAPVGKTVTGAEAVALIERAGKRCVVLNEESTEAEWDISDSPANLNPCGPGTMTLTPVRSGQQ